MRHHSAVYNHRAFTFYPVPPFGIHLFRMILRSLRLCVPAAVLSLGCAQAQTPAPAPLVAAPATAPAATSLSATVGNDMIEPFKLSEMDIDGVIALLEMLTGRTVVRPAALPTALYSIHLKRPLPRSEAVAALETVLSLNGIGVAPLGDKLLKVVALAQIRTEAPEMLTVPARSLPPSGRIAAKLFQPDYIRVNEFAQQAQAMGTQGIGVTTVLFPTANAALITETISNLQRLETLMEQLDRPALLPKFYTLKFAKASELVQKMQGILQNQTLQAQFGTSTTYSADDRTNQVILVADSQQQTFFDELINRLDVKADPNTRTEVIYLKHAAAKDVASLLTNLISGQNSAASKSGGSQLLTNRVDGAPNANPQAPVVVTATRGGPAGAGASAGSSATFSSIVTIMADERTNAVVANGTMDDLRLIKELVDKVDIILAQVRIEVVIVEVELTNNEATGIDSLNLQVDANKLIGIGGGAAGLSLSGSTTTTNSTTGTTAYAGLATLGARNSLTGIIGLASNSTKSKSSILSNPTITTTHNKEAEIFVGTGVPTISSYLNDSSGSSSSSSYSGGYRSTVSSQEVGIRLTVTPLIGDDGSVQLDIKQEINSLGEPTKIDNNTQYQINKRTTKSFITVKNGEIIVLGGLQKTEDVKGRSRLGPIPIIGDLLGGRTSLKKRTDLLLFLRPRVLQGNELDNKDAYNQVESLTSKEAIKKTLDLPPPADSGSKAEASPSDKNHRK